MYIQHIGASATNRLELSRMEHTLQKSRIKELIQCCFSKKNRDQRYQIEDPDQIKTKLSKYKLKGQRKNTSTTAQTTRKPSSVVTRPLEMYIRII